MIAVNQIHNLDALEMAKQLPDQSIHCIITSPPYYGLRDYGVTGQIGLEDTPAAYVARLVELFRELRRALRDDGTLWVNLGDSYAGSNQGATGHNGIGDQVNRQGFASGYQARMFRKNEASRIIAGKATTTVSAQNRDGLGAIEGIKPKSLLMIPARVAIALQDDGWILRQDIIWSKPAPMPESVKDRCTKSHEYVFLLAKSGRYYFDSDAIKEPATYGENLPSFRGNGAYVNNRSFDNSANHKANTAGIKRPKTEDRNKRSVWTVNTEPTPFAHFATFPQKLIEPMILAGCPKGGVVYDPFMGSGTTALVARRLGRDFMGSELNPEYCELARQRLALPYTPSLFPETQATEKPMQNVMFGE